ncbi:hypothetical protein QJQ45_011267 [Haematococcus lacustris]|nr:hypothetical protein QJQ45_011267 [Haematococcus lacustris]
MRLTQTHRLGWASTPASPRLARWKLTKGQVKHASGLNTARRDTERWLAPIKPHLQHLAAASSAGTSLEANLKHITVILATWDAVWEVCLDPKWARQRLRLYGALDQALEQFFKKLEDEIAEVATKRYDCVKQLVVYFGSAGNGTQGGWGADTVLLACCKPPCSQAATQAAASEPGPITPPPAKRSKRTKAEQAAEPTQPTQPTKACSATDALNFQCIGESMQRPLELCSWMDRESLPPIGKEYQQGYKLLEKEMAELAMKRHNCTKQLVVFFGTASIGTAGGWGADAVLRACCKVVCRPKGAGQRRGRVVLVDEHRTTRVSSAVNGKQPCEEERNHEQHQACRLEAPSGAVAPNKPPQAPCSSHEATPAAASEPGPSSPPPAKRSKRTKAEQAAEPTQPTKAAKAKPAPQPGRWLDRDCNAALNM